MRIYRKDFIEWGRLGGQASGRMRQRRLIKAGNRGDKPPTGTKPPPVWVPLKKHDKRGRPMGSTTPDISARNQKIVDMFLSKAVTLEDIGAKMGVSRERIRQILKKNGVSNADGALNKSRMGIAMSETAIRERHRAEMDNARYEKYLFCSKETYLELCGHALASTGAIYSGKTPAARYWSQRHVAEGRGISWALTFPEWWAIWQESGKWELRGRGQGKYVMARFGDSGAYEIGNVQIILAVENNSDRPQKKNGLPMGVQRRGIKFIASKMIKGKNYHIGKFPTPWEASAAYLAFDGPKR